jgi:hypothetical protein
MGQLFHSLGLLSEPEVVECSASAFVTGFANQASGQTRKIFESALGKVLFVDEAYRLIPQRGGPMVGEALDEMVQMLTEPKFKNKLVFIMAGSERDVDQLMGVNPGLRSRMGDNKWRFENFTPEDASRILRDQLTRKGLRLDQDAEPQLLGMMRELVAAPNWSNGRDVENYSKRVFRRYAVRQGRVSGATLPPIRFESIHFTRQLLPPPPPSADRGLGHLSGPSDGA